MMVRDSGHALTLEIDETTKNPFLSYFIPKICNAEKINQLKGVTKADLKDSKAIFGSTVGIFELGEKGKQNIGQEVIQFVEKVPTDNDLVMDFENEKLINLDLVFSEKNENFQKTNVIVQKEETSNTNNLPKKQNFFQKFFAQTRKKIIKIFNNNGNFNNVEEKVNTEVKKEEKSWYINSAEKEEVNNRISKIVNKVKESEKNLVSEKTEEENDR